MSDSEQNKSQYTPFEIEFLKNVYLSKKVAEEKYRITSDESKTKDGPSYGLQTREFDKSTRPDYLPRDTWLPQGLEDYYNKKVDEKYPDTKQTRVGIFLLPQSDFPSHISSEDGQKQLLAAFEKFGGIKYDSDYTYGTTSCALDATSEATFYTKGSVQNSTNGIKNIFKQAENFVNNELSTQEKSILDLAVKKYVGSETSCGRDNVTGLESTSLHLMINSFVKNNVRGGQEISATETAKINTQLTASTKDFNMKESVANDLNEFKQAAKAHIK